MWRYAKVPLATLGMVVVGFTLLVALLKLNNPGPKTEIEIYFAKVLNEADVSDHYDWTGNGWDSEDVTDKVCDRVDVSILLGLGMSKEPIWPAPRDGTEVRPTYVWQMGQDKGFFAACEDHSIRQLRIEIDAETLACTATVMPYPTCDM
jgi:hypothetical protein